MAFATPAAGGLGRRRRSGLVTALVNRGYGAFPTGGPVRGQVPPGFQLNLPPAEPYLGGVDQGMKQQIADVTRSRELASVPGGVAGQVPDTNTARPPWNPMLGGPGLTTPPPTNGEVLPKPMFGGLGIPRRRGLLAARKPRMGLGFPGY